VSVAANVNSPLRGVRRGRVKESAEQTSGEATRGKTKLRIQLTADEHAELRRAVSDIGFPNMALLVFQAIHTGLEEADIVGVQRKHTKSVTIHVSRQFKQKIQVRARMYGVPQQSILHALLFQYIRNKRWQTAEENTANQTVGVKD
jgi:hypothetical protein